MSIAMPYGKNAWFTEQPSTGAFFDFNRTVTLTSLASMMIGLGTGVFNIDLDLYRRIHKHDSYSSIPIPNISEQYQVAPIANVPSPKLQVEQILKVFSPTISGLAEVFKVSRQTIYNWINGKPVDSAYLDKLEDLNCAANIYAEAGIPMTGWLLKRKIMEGKSLLEVVRDDGSAQEAVSKLIQIIRIENEQRKRLDVRLAGRKASFRSPESDFPAENDING